MFWSKRKTAAPAQAPIPEMPADFSVDVPDWWPVVDGLPRPEWEKIYEHIGAVVPEADATHACTQAAVAWLKKLGGALGPDYKVFSSAQYLLLSTREVNSARELLTFCETTEAAILKTFELTYEDVGYGKGVVLLFHDIDTYYQYGAYYYPDEGHFAGTGGTYIPHGYGHIILPDGENWAVSSTLTHELVHSCLANLELPLWVEEGMIRLMERKLGRFGAEPMLTPEDKRDHLRYWNPTRIQQFWRGESFSMPDPAQKLSYNLAEILVSTMLQEQREEFTSFMHSANREDSGDAAAQECFGLTVGELAASFLGDGGWEVEVSPENLV